MQRQLHIAFYLPQFHPIPENDRWWGTGFTEWTSVAQSRPRFWGHMQPDIPGELGFYDLRLPETRLAQAALAQEYGIDGFCYYHYWFGGKQLLERPFAEVLRSGEPEMPFCLAWANEPWTRRWDGGDHDVLQPQDYETAQVEHTEWLLTAFRDERYIRVDGKPIFLVYLPSKIPDSNELTGMWRAAAKRAGIGELFLCAIDRYAFSRVSPESMGFDAAVAFAAPGYVEIPPAWEDRARRFKERLGVRLRVTRSTCTTRRYSAFAQAMREATPVPYTRFPCVAPGWDNSPRKQVGAWALTRSSPERYGEWVHWACENAPSVGGDSLVFINAWNEWAEGAHLEPGRRWGRQYLEAHRAARENVAGATDSGCPQHESER